MVWAFVVLMGVVVLIVAYGTFAVGWDRLAEPAKFLFVDFSAQVIVPVVTLVIGYYFGKEKWPDLVFAELALNQPAPRAAMASAAWRPNRGTAWPAGEPCPGPADTMPRGRSPGLLQKSLSSIDVVASIISGGSSSKVTSSRFEVAESRELDLAGPVVDDRLLFEVDVVERLDRVGKAGGIVVVGAHGKDRAGARGEPGGKEEDDEDDDDDPADGRPAASSRLRWSARRWRWRRARVVCMSGRTIA